MIRVDTGARILSGHGITTPCEIGRGGTRPGPDKREGDGATPLGDWPVLAALFRRDRIAVPEGIRIPWRWIGREDGWSDDPADPAYNRPVFHPHPFSAEHLWRDDGLYDVILVIGHNLPPVPGLGSAVFLHCLEGRPTAGCVAIDRALLAALVGRMEPGEIVRIA